MSCNVTMHCANTYAYYKFKTYAILITVAIVMLCYQPGSMTTWSLRMGQKSL